MVLWGQIRSSMKTLSGIKNFATEFTGKIAPEFVAEVQKAQQDDLKSLSPQQLLDRLQFWIRRTLVQFASQSLKPTLFASTCLQILEQQLQKPLGPERTRTALNELSAGVTPEVDHDLARGTREIASGKISREEFLQRFGHRGNQEMELAAPRWREETNLNWHSHSESPKHDHDPEAIWKRISDEAKFPGMVSRMLGSRVEQLRTYLGLREAGKNLLLRGYELIRQTLLELDRRFSLRGGIFFLRLDELPKLLAGEKVTSLIQPRRKERQLLLGLELPTVLLDTDLEAIGRPLPAPSGASELQGVPLSAGVVEGPALVLTEPTPQQGDGFILVCPSTDPSWVPLFVQAKGLVMESGGVLSHGAIVAREFGLPAVAGLPSVHRQLKTGQRIRVDGNRGRVMVLDE
jgi:pyruvate,water dikinase